MNGTQFDMFGAPPKRPPLPKGEDRILFALYPDEAAIAAIVERNRELRARFGLRGPVRPPHVLHITLRHVADTVGPPPDAVDLLSAAAAKLRCEPFDIVLTDALTFAGGVFVLKPAEARNAALMAFQRGLCEALDGSGAAWSLSGKGFNPHVTQSYKEPPVETPIEPITWTAREFLLVHSPQGKTLHRPLARFPLK